MITDYFWIIIIALIGGWILGYLTAYWERRPASADFYKGETTWQH